MSPNHRRQGRGKIETDPDRQARSFSTCQASRPPHTDVIVITRVLGRGTRRSQRRKDLFRSRSRPPELLLADLASADSLSSSWTIPNRAAAHDVLSSKRRSPSSPRSLEKLEAELARAKKKNSSTSSKPPSSDIVKPPNLPPKGKGKPQAKSAAGTPASPATSLPLTTSTRRGSIPGRLALIAVATSR